MKIREAAIIGAYTGVLLGKFSDMHTYIEEILGRPVFTHEMGFREVADEIKKKSHGDFVALSVTDKEGSKEDAIDKINDLKEAFDIQGYEHD